MGNILLFTIRVIMMLTMFSTINLCLLIISVVLWDSTFMDIGTVLYKKLHNDK